MQCVAAHLNSAFLDDSIPQSDAYSWIRLGFDNGNQKLFIRNTAASEAVYTYKPNDPSQAIGYEGCWDIDEYEILGRLAPAANNYVTIHFDKDTSDGMNRNTVSTGMENGSEYCSKYFAIQYILPRLTWSASVIFQHSGGTVCLSQDCSTRRPTKKVTEPI